MLIVITDMALLKAMCHNRLQYTFLDIRNAKSCTPWTFQSARDVPGKVIDRYKASVWSGSRRRDPTLSC